jgi:hypothetical protein
MAVKVIISHCFSSFEKILTRKNCHSLAHAFSYVSYNFLGVGWERFVDIDNSVELLKKNFLVCKTNSIHRPAVNLKSCFIEALQVVKFFLFSSFVCLHIILNCVKCTQSEIEYENIHTQPFRKLSDNSRERSADLTKYVITKFDIIISDL